MPGSAHRTGLRAQITALVLAAYFYVLMEWLFFATKPSFLAAMDLRQQLALLLITPLPIVVVGGVLAIAPWLLGALVRPAAWGAAVRRIGWAAPAAILACAAVLLIDNFTYTLFKVGIVSTAGRGRAAYAALVVGLFVLAWRTVERTERRGTGLTLLATGLVALSLVCAIWRHPTASPALDVQRPLGGAPGRLPNIVLLSTDGLEAAHMSAYGYARDTTPTIERMMPEMLVCENAFHNGGHTAASNASLLTGRLPLDTGLLYEGRVLRGADAYRHLPGILRRLGYRSMHISIRPYGDPFAWNMRDGFDVANRRRVLGATETRLPAMPSAALGTTYASELYFLEEMYWRIADRLQHIAGIKTMTNPFLEVRKETTLWTDDLRLAETVQFIHDSPRPFFVHVHLMGTHPPFYPRTRVFSRHGVWGATDVYDDTVLDFDGYVRAIVELLARDDLLDDTIVVILSDHGKRWRDARLPLLFRFPGGAHRSVITTSVQLLDVSPTLLDYLGVPIPAWMQGRSLLAAAPDPMRPIFSMRVKLKHQVWFLSSVAVTVCDRLYRLDTRTDSVTATRIKGHTMPCDDARVPTLAQADRLLRDQLRRYGCASSGTMRAGRRPMITECARGA